MNHTSRMSQLLKTFRREMNGQAAAAMRYYGKIYGLNYGVSLPTLRTIARAEAADHEFARYLYRQDIRELRLAAFWIAEPEQLTPAEAPFWGDGIVNSELAEEAAFALVSRTPCIEELYTVWMDAAQPLLLNYTALLAASRTPGLTTAFLPAAEDVVRRNPDDGLTARGVVALLAALLKKEENRHAVSRMVSSLGASPSADLIHEEIAWRMEP